MARYAQAPTGEILEFPDETPDSVMDRAMREFVGAPEPVDPMQVQLAVARAVIDAVERVSASVQDLAVLVQQTNEAAGNRQGMTEEALLSGVRDLSDEVKSQADVLKSQSDALQDTFAAMSTQLARMYQAYTAPRKLIPDANGKPAAVVIQLPNEEQL